MRYMLLICGDDSAVLTDEQSAEMARDGVAWAKEMDERGVRLHGARLRPAAEATTVRVRDERLAVSDGPFAETKEQVGGYDLIECANLDEAIEVASRHPVARFGTVEVRPLWEQ
jgi:hypothetical protein